MEYQYNDLIYVIDNWDTDGNIELRLLKDIDLDRDANAAMNILSAGLADYTCGDSVKPAMVGVCEARTPLFQ